MTASSATGFCAAPTEARRRTSPGRWSSVQRAALENAPAKRLIGMHAAHADGRRRHDVHRHGHDRRAVRQFLPAAAELTVDHGLTTCGRAAGYAQGRSSCSAVRCSRDELGCIGPVAAATVRRYHADLAVLGGRSRSARSGITELERRGRRDPAPDGRALRTARDRSPTARSSAQTAMASVAGSARISTLITDDKAAAPGDCSNEALRRRDRPGRPTHQAPAGPRPRNRRPRTQPALRPTNRGRANVEPEGSVRRREAADRHVPPGGPAGRPATTRPVDGGHRPFGRGARPGGSAVRRVSTASCFATRTTSPTRHKVGVEASWPR